MLRLALSKIAGVANEVWKRQTSAMKQVSRVPSLEGRYRLCAKIYLRLMGGIRNDPELLADVNRWETMCVDYTNAQAMRTAIRDMNANAVTTGTIHSAKGGEWDHVLVVGATDGLLPLYLSRDDKNVIGEERNLLYVAITRARNSVKLYHAPTNHARSRQRFENVSRFLDTPSTRKAVSVDR